MILYGVAPLFVYTEFNMFKWLTGLFKDGRCKCRGCEITRYGWGYAPCSNAKATEIRQPPRKL